MEEVFANLESNNVQTVENAKKELTKTFSQTKEPWLVHGMMDYFSQTNSGRIVDILVKVQAPHDTYIFDRLLEWLNMPKRDQALFLFWHIVKRHPSWLYKVASHQFFKELLRVLKAEDKIITAMNALFCIIILLPIIPTSMPQYLQELVDIFVHFANWKATNNPKLSEVETVHLQIGISILFQQLYGMYPWNFILFLRERVKEYPQSVQRVISPLFETVKMHPMLLTSSRESEKSSSRWKEMEPHDVVVECAKLSLEESLVQIHPFERQNSENAWCNQSHESTANNSHLPDALVSLSSNLSAKQKNRNPQNVPIWSPSFVVLATPPPTSTVSHTPTSTPINQNYTIPSNPSVQYTASGASPPEAAVEATPETTPMKDFEKPHRPFPVNSTAVRTIWANMSQPSSPLKKEDNSPFRQADGSNLVGIESSYITNSSKFYRLVNDRYIAKMQFDTECIHNIHDIEDDSGQVDSHLAALSTDNSQDDEEVTQINMVDQHILLDDENNKLTNNIDMLTDLRRRNLAKCHQKMNIEENQTDLNDHRSTSSSQYSILTSSLMVKSARDAITKTPTESLRLIKENEVCSTETQTDQYLQQYINILEDLIKDEIERKRSAGKSSVCPGPLSPHKLLDQYMEISIKKNSSSDPQTRTSELQLLNLQLQYERYRREVHAERNRRLLGKSRDNAVLKTDNDRLKYQLEKQSKELEIMRGNLNIAKLQHNAKEQENIRELNRLRGDIEKEREENKQLSLKIESNERNLKTELDNNKKLSSNLETTQSEIFDLKNLLQQCQYQADIGTHYKEELHRLQSKEVLMGEIQLKVSEKLNELHHLRAKDVEIEALKNSCNEEVKELQAALDLKSSQYENARERIMLLESQLSRRDSQIAKQEAQLKTVKEEYEEKLKAVEAKYSAQKAIVLRLEESILDLYKNRSAVNLSTILPESDKTDVVGSLDHTSPLSISFASSEGLSLSLRSVTEIRNLEALVAENNATTSLAANATTFSSSNFNGLPTPNNSRQIVSDDIPVPGTSQNIHSHHHQ